MADDQITPYQTVMPVSEAGGPHVLDVGGGVPDPISGGLEEQFPDSEPDNDIDDNSEEMLKALAQAMQEQLQKQQDMRATLAREVEAKLQKRMGTRKNKENQWLEAMRIYLGSLSSYNIITGDYPFGTVDHPFGTRQDDSAIHRPEFNIIRQKCNMAIATTVSHQFAAGDKNWDILPPKVLDMDEEDIQQILQMTDGQGAQLTLFDIAELKADLMEKEIEYHLQQTNYASEARKALADRVILGTGVLKGPFNAGKLKKVYEKQTTSDGQVVRVPKLITEVTPCVYRVNLWYWFPDDSVTDAESAEDCIEVHPMSKTDLADLLKHPGYYADELALCLKEEPRQYTNSPFNDPAYLTEGINLLKNKYLVLEYHGPIKKADIEALGLNLDDDDPMDEVYGEIWVCNSRVIRFQLSTLEGCYRLPYYACVWEPDPAKIFGFGIPMLARDQQRVVNETYKMVLDNAGISAGPQVVVDTTIIKPAEGGMECTPWKVWLANEYGADTNKAIQFFTPENSFEELAALIALARGFADEESSINLYTGNVGNTPAQLDSATGKALADENAMTPLFFKSEEWDDHMTKPLIESMYDWEMQYNPKEEIKGTYCIDVRTTTAYLKGLMDQQKLTNLFQEIAQGSPITEWINMDELIQARLAVLKLPWQGIVKSPQEVALARKQAADAAAQNPPPPDPNMVKAQAMMEKNQIDREKMQADQERLAFEKQKHVQEMELQYQTQLMTNQSKERQHELNVAQAQAQAGLQKHQIDTNAGVQIASLNTKAAIEGTKEQTKKQVAGLKHQQHSEALKTKDDIAWGQIASKERQAREKNMVDLRKIAVDREATKVEQANRRLTQHNPSPSK